MKFNFSNEDFEKFIKQQADQLRMRPSDKVWDNISGEMHTKRRWVGLALLFFLISATSVSTWLYLANRTHGAQHASLKQPETTIANNNKQLLTGTIQRVSSVNEQHKPHAVILNLPMRNQDRLLGHARSTTGSSDVITNIAERFDQNAPSELQDNGTSAAFEGTFADSYPTGSPMSVKESVSTSEHEPMSIESVVNKYRGQRSKLSWQFYFTPTISYRKLTENKSYLRKLQQQPTNSATNFAELYNINDVVTHRPDIGLELGVAAKYELGKRIKIRGGLQFNLAHYDIKAFDVYTPQVATIALNAGNRIDSVNTVTKYRNLGGPTTSWLQNFYYQISAPVGVDVILSKGHNVQFGVSTTIQPTYVLGERAYMISSDYQNYTKVPWLMRKWNVNTSLETFVSYSTGQLKWQVGPQVRYQLLSSFVNEYPVKENLFDFGLKVGVGLNK